MRTTAAQPRPGLMLAALALAAGVLSLAGCDYGEKPPVVPTDGLKLEQAYTNQTLGEGGRAEYKFHAGKRGAYLIMVYGNPTPLDITLQHPKKTCYLAGNGSCELVSGPNESYGFQVSSDSGEPVQFSVMVSHSEGRGRFEGDVARPVALESGSEHSGTVGVHESSYYAFTASAGGSHTIALTGTQSDLVWRLFDAPEFDVIVQECDFQPGAADEACSTQPLNARQRYYVKVEERSGVPGPYRLVVHTP